MQKPAVIDWDRVIHKNVRTSDLEQIGNIGSEDGESIVILGDRSVQYKVPKSHVAEFDGSQVHLDLPMREMGKYIVK